MLILPWNLQDEITEQMTDVHAWGGRFVTPVPRVEIHERSSWAVEDLPTA